MTRLIYSVAGLAAAMLGLSILIPKMQNEGVGLDMTTTASIPRTGQYFNLSALEIGAACSVFKGARVSSGLYEIIPEPSCQMLIPGIAKVRFWQQKPEGVVELKGEGGETLAAFSESDGRGYESFRPRAPLMTLTPRLK